MAEAALAVVDGVTEGAAEKNAMVENRVAIGIVMPWGSQRGGAEALLQHLMRHAGQQHRYICAFLEDGPLVEEARSLGYDAIVFPTTRLSHLHNYLATARGLRSWIKAKKLRLVVSWMPKAHVYVSIAALFLPVRVVWFQHGVPNGHLMDRLITFLPASAVLCCSGTSKRGQDQMFPKRQSYVCYPGVAFSTGTVVSQDEAREILDLPGTGPIVGMVARLEQWKGAHIFVEAAAAILKRYPDATMFIVGGEHPFDKAYTEKVHSMARELHCGNRFILAGQRPMTEVRFWQAAADVIVQPTVGAEPFGMAIIEAMALGKVVVASDSGGPAEVIQTETSGILIRSGDPNLLASTVIQLLEEPERRIAIEKEAAVRARDFSADIFASRFDDLMAELLLP